MPPNRTLTQRAWNTVRSPMQSQEEKDRELFNSVENGDYNRVLKYLNRGARVTDYTFYGNTYNETVIENFGGIIGRLWFHPTTDRTKEEINIDIQIFRVLLKKYKEQHRRIVTDNKYTDIYTALVRLFLYAEQVESREGWEGERGGGSLMAVQAAAAAAATHAHMLREGRRAFPWQNQTPLIWNENVSRGLDQRVEVWRQRREDLDFQGFEERLQEVVRRLGQPSTLREARQVPGEAQEDPQPVDANGLALVPILQRAQRIPQIDLPNTDAKINAIDLDDIEDGEEIVDIFTNNHHFYFRLTSINKWLTVQPGNNYTLPQGKILLGTKGNPNPAAGVVITRGLARVAVDGGYKRKRKSRSSRKTKRSKGSRSLGK